MRLRSVLVAVAVGALATGCLVKIEKVGLGILTEVEEEGGGQVLVWLS